MSISSFKSRVRLEDENDTIDSAQSSVNQAMSIPVTLQFLVKGGDVDCRGKNYVMDVNKTFNYVYVDYARMSRVATNNLWLFHCKKFLRPDETPFAHGFNVPMLFWLT